MQIISQGKYLQQSHCFLHSAPLDMEECLLTDVYDDIIDSEWQTAMQDYTALSSAGMDILIVE